MNTFDYKGIGLTALKLLERFGLVVTIIRYAVEGSPRPWEHGGRTETTATGRGVLDSYSIADVDGVSILSSDVRLYLAASGLELVPEVGDLVEANGTRYNVMAVRPTAPGGVAVLYELQLRR